MFISPMNDTTDGNTTKPNIVPIYNSSNDNILDEAERAKLDAVKNVNKQEKEKEDDIAFVSELEALRKATNYAADVMGLPPDCPAACAQICLPAWCSERCCSKSLISSHDMNILTKDHSVQPLPHGPPNFFSATTGARSFPAVKPFRNPTTREIINAQRKYLLAMRNNPQFIRNVAMKRLALQNKLRGRNIRLPSAAQYNALVYTNQVNKQRRLLQKSQARALQLARASHYCPYPLTCHAGVVPIGMSTCPNVCHLSCIPQCPNECCLLSTKVASKKKMIPRA